MTVRCFLVIVFQVPLVLLPASGCAPNGGQGRRGSSALSGFDEPAMVAWRDSAKRAPTGLVAGSTFLRAAHGDARPVRMAVFGDGHASTKILRHIAVAARDSSVDLAVIVGDAVGVSNEGQFVRFLEAVLPLVRVVPLWPVIGNHDRGPAYFQTFMRPDAPSSGQAEAWYSIRWGSVWMAMLDTDDLVKAGETGIETPEVAWLRAGLASPEARTADWRLLFVHQPPYSLGWDPCIRGYHGEAGLRRVLLPLASQAGVSVVFSGHVHGYERGQVDGMTLIVTGGAGGTLDHSCRAPEGFPSPWLTRYQNHWVLVEAGPGALVIEAIGLDGVAFDRVESPAGPPRTEWVATRESGSL